MDNHWRGPCASIQRLRQISGRLREATDEAALARMLVDGAAGIMRSDLASMQVMEGTGELRLRAHLGFPPEAAAFWDIVRADASSVCGMSLRRADRVVVPDVERCTPIVGSGHLPIFRLSGIRSVQTTPLVSRTGHVVGALSTHWHRPYEPPQDALDLLDLLARQAADWIERRRTERALLELRRSNDEFLAVLSHELRTPLNSILGWSQMLQDDDLTPDMRRRGLESIARSAITQGRLVDDLLDISRATFGKLQVGTELIDLVSIIAASADSFRPAAAVRRIEFEASIDADSPIHVRGDAHRIQQIVSNLLSNAIKFTPSGGRVELHLQRRGQAAEIVVRDTGDGIEPEFLADVFDKFRQREEATRRSGGLGLGLTLVRCLAEAHGGTVSVESAGRGHGAAFVVRLPISPAPTES